MKDITKLDVSGCLHVTDVGVHWLAQMLPFCPSLRRVGHVARQQLINNIEDASLVRFLYTSYFKLICEKAELLRMHL